MILCLRECKGQVQLLAAYRGFQVGCPFRTCAELPDKCFARTDPRRSFKFSSMHAHNGGGQPFHMPLRICACAVNLWSAIYYGAIAALFALNELCRPIMCCQLSVLGAKLTKTEVLDTVQEYL